MANFGRSLFRLYGIRSLPNRAFRQNGRLDLEIHFAKAGTVYSKDAKAQTKFMQDIELATSTYYYNNLSEEVIKGMTEKAAQGFYPGRAPFGYRNNRETRNIEPSAETSPFVKRAYELYATGQYSLMTLRKQLREEFGKAPARSHLHYLLTNTHYVGLFEWRGVTYRGNYETFIGTRNFSIECNQSSPASTSQNTGA